MENWKKQQLARLKKVFIEEPELTDAEVAERFGLPKSTVMHIRRRIGIKRGEGTTKAI